MKQYYFCFKKSDSVSVQLTFAAYIVLSYLSVTYRITENDRFFCVKKKTKNRKRVRPCIEQRELNFLIHKFECNILIIR